VLVLLWQEKKRTNQEAEDREDRQRLDPTVGDQASRDRLVMAEAMRGCRWPSLKRREQNILQGFLVSVLYW